MVASLGWGRVWIQSDSKVSSGGDEIVVCSDCFGGYVDLNICQNV